MKKFAFILTLGGILLMPSVADAITLESRPQTPITGAVMLKGNVQLSGKYILLGDVFNNSGERSNIPIAYTPPPGKRAIFDARWLYRTAMKNNLKWRPLSKHVQIVVERKSQLINREEIAELVLSALIDQGVDPSLSVSLSNKSLRLYIPSESLADIGIEDLAYNESSRRFSALVVAPANSPSATRLRVTGKLERMNRVPVLNRRLSKQDVITESDISWIKIRSQRLQRDTILDIDELIGKSPRRGIREGSPIKMTQVSSPIMIKKGSLVSIILKSGKMSLTTRGKALENGSNGQAIRVLNTRSNTTIEAEVVNEGQVVVSLSSIVAMK